MDDPSDVVHWRPDPPSTTPLVSLKRAMLSELKVESLNRGLYILVKTSSLRAEVFQLEDEAGNKAKAWIYFHSGQRLIDESLGTARVVVIREPICKAAKDGDRMILIYHISDITPGPYHGLPIVIPKRWDFPKGQLSAVEWKEKGNKSIQKKKFYYAIAW